MADRLGVAGCGVVELRQYTLHPGRRDDLIDLFDREFVESQEALGALLIGQFRDLGRPDRFVWLRGFRDMETRLSALTAFYSGPVWKRNSAAANETMIDSSDVLLLRPVTGLADLPADRPPVGAGPQPSSILFATVHRDRPDFERPPLALFETEHADNTFPALPVRTGEDVFVSLTRSEHPDPDPAQRLRLAPTDRSLLR